jgi:hypothetical protein
VALSIPFQDFVRLVSAVTATVALAACNQTMPVANKSGLSAANREASLESSRPMMHRRGANRAIKHAIQAHSADFSYIIRDSQFHLTTNRPRTAKIQPKAMTAAHPTLLQHPVARYKYSDGIALTVRINDRGSCSGLSSTFQFRQRNHWESSIGALRRSNSMSSIKGAQWR